MSYFTSDLSHSTDYGKVVLPAFWDVPLRTSSLHVMCRPSGALNVSVLRSGGFAPPATCRRPSGAETSGNINCLKVLNDASLAKNRVHVEETAQAC